MNNLIDGKKVSQEIREQLTKEVQYFKEKTGVTPTLAAVLVGDDPASHTYVKMKNNALTKVGLRSQVHTLPADSTQEQVIALIDKLNEAKDVHGILVQHPVSSHMDERAIFDRILPVKDVDGVTSQGFGYLSFDVPTYPCCTPGGIMTLLEYYKVEIKGAEAVVVGRSPILGKPMAMMLLSKHATVTICHSRTKNLSEVCQRADILVAGVGKPKFIKGDWIKPGAVIIDAGYNPGNIGDVDFEQAKDKAGLITPVPGGVGPMTITTLIQNTFEAAKRITSH